MNIKIPYLTSKLGAEGRRLWRWEPGPGLRAGGFKGRALGGDEMAAIEEARRLNALAEQWRAGRDVGDRMGAAPGTVKELIADYQRSRLWRNIKPKTQRDYRHCLNRLEDWAGDKPVAAVTSRAVKIWYENKLLPASPAMANAIMRVCRVAFGFAVTDGRVATNPFSNQRLEGSRRAPRIWTAAEIAAFVAAAGRLGRPSMGTAVMLNGWLGQREGDIIAMRRDAIQGGEILIRQSKRGAAVKLPVGMIPELAARLAGELARGAAGPVGATTILVSEATGLPYTAEHFRKSFAAIRAAAGIDPALKFMHLRHTAVTRLGETGATTAQIRDVTGHGLKTCEQILELYMVRTGQGAREAFRRRLESERLAAEEEQENQRAMDERQA